MSFSVQIKSARIFGKEKAANNLGDKMRCHAPLVTPHGIG